MQVLVVRPIARNERFGLGPFFRIEPLGLEYIAAALQQRGHAVRIADLRFAPPIERLLRRQRPALVGIAASHTLDTEDALELARRIKRAAPSVFVLLGGHAAAVYPSPFFAPEVDAICFEDGERVVPDLADALERRRSLEEVAGLWVNTRGARYGGRQRRATDPPRFVRGPTSPTRIALDRVPLPARELMRPFQHNYLCVNMRPVYLVETSRGCPYRCSFCTIWQHVDRTFRYRAIEHVSDDLARVGDKVFIADDLFWHPRRRSFELAKELGRRGIRKHWALVQTRTDLVARNPQLLEAWRGFAHYFDIFFGFESPTDRGLSGFGKDATVRQIEQAVDICRRLDYGITGNFIVDPDWDEEDFERLWDFTARLGLNRAGYTILTPLPGTAYYEQTKQRIRERDWSRYDMHHILWEPRLGRKRFFELFAESWKRTVLYARGPRPWHAYLKTIRPAQLPYLLKVLYRTQRLVRPAAYLAESFAPEAQPRAAGLQPASESEQDTSAA